jgi:hypothetical protein
MMFVQTEKGGYVNLDTAVCIEEADDGTYLVKDGAGTFHEMPQNFNPYECRGQIIPAAYPMTLLWIAIEKDGTATISRHQIIAWQFDVEGAAMPIAAGFHKRGCHGGNNWRGFVQKPNGGFSDYERGRDFNTVDDCVQYVRDGFPF